MSIKRYVAEKDTTIADSFLTNYIDRSLYSNMGASDSLELFSIYGQVGDSIEKSRILVQFPIEQIHTDRISGKLPSSGSVKFFLKLFNVEHPFSLPRDYIVNISTVSQSWDEGYGLDMETYTDIGWNIQKINGSGANWIFAQSASAWTTPGGNALSSLQYNYNFDIKDGTEDIEVDVTNTVEAWINSDINNNGFLIRLSGAYEDGSLKQSFYTKKFSARGSEYFYKRPTIEARWEAVSTDDRNNFFASSSALSEEDNRMNIYFYNKVNGKLKNIVNNTIPGIKLYSDPTFNNEITASYKNITNPSIGVYRANLSVDTTASVLYDKWYNTSSSDIYFNSSLDVLRRENYDFDHDEEYIVSISNNKLVYNQNETAKFKIFARQRDWQPTIYKVAYNTIENEIVPNLYYKIFRLNDNYVVVDYSTGSLAYTKTSYDSNGNYFELDMSILEKNYTYGVKLARWDGIEIKELPTTFKFKVE